MENGNTGLIQAIFVWTRNWFRRRSGKVKCTHTYTSRTHNSN